MIKRRREATTRSVFARQRRRQCGVAALELALALPVLLAVVLGIIFYGLVFVLQQALTMAAMEGSRAALRFQPTLTARVSAAEATARGALPAFISSRMASGDVAATSEPCTAPAGFECVTVQVRFNLTGGATPFLPNIVFVPLPTQLQARATSQLGPD